jgi:hypothetical protein
LFCIQNVAMQKSVEIIEFEHAKTGSRSSYLGGAASRLRRHRLHGLSPQVKASIDDRLIYGRLDWKAAFGRLFVLDSTLNMQARFTSQVQTVALAWICRFRSTRSAVSPGFSDASIAWLALGSGKGETATTQRIAQLRNIASQTLSIKRLRLFRQKNASRTNRSEPLITYSDDAATKLAR